MTDSLEKIVESLFDAWGKYEAFFGEPPRGTHKQLAALVELAPALIPSKAEREFLAAAIHWWPMIAEMEDAPGILRDPWDTAFNDMNEKHRALLAERGK